MLQYNMNYCLTHQCIQIFEDLDISKKRLAWTNGFGA